VRARRRRRFPARAPTRAEVQFCWTLDSFPAAYAAVHFGDSPSVRDEAWKSLRGSSELPRKTPSTVSKAPRICADTQPGVRHRRGRHGHVRRVTNVSHDARLIHPLGFDGPFSPTTARLLRSPHRLPEPRPGSDPVRARPGRARAGP
jgi:hypothetical protein